MQEIFDNRQSGESLEICSRMDDKLKKLFIGNDYDVYGLCKYGDEEENIFFVKKTISEEELDEQLEYVEKICLLRNMDLEQIEIKALYDLGSLSFKNENLYFSNIIYTRMVEEKFTVENLSKDERENIVNYLKKQNEIILKNIVIKDSMFSMIFALNIDTIIKISEKNEFEYFDQIFKNNGCDFENILPYLLIKWIKFDSEEEHNSILIDQYIEFYGTKKIEKIYKGYLKDPTKVKMFIEGINELTYQYLLNKENLLHIVKVANEKNAFLFDKNTSYIEIDNQEVLIDFNRFFMEIQKVFDQTFLKYIHSEIETLHSAELFLSLGNDKVFVKSGNIVDIKHNYENLLDEILKKAKDDVLPKNFLESQEVKDLMREAYLKSITTDKGAKIIPIRKKI